MVKTPQKRIGLFRELVPNMKRLGFVGTTSILAVTEIKRPATCDWPAWGRTRASRHSGGRRYRESRCGDEPGWRGRPICVGRTAYVYPNCARGDARHGVRKTVVRHLSRLGARGALNVLFVRHIRRRS